MTLVGSMIRSEREDAGFAQDAFAESIGLDRSYYGHVERGHYNLTLEVLFRIANGLSVEPATLVPSLKQIKDVSKKAGLEKSEFASRVKRATIVRPKTLGK